MDRLTAPPIRTALQSEDAKQNTTKEWYLFWNNSANQINQQAQTLAQQGAILAELVTHGTHANRPAAAAMPDGALYVEDDRGALYENRSGTWYFVAGTMWGTISPDQRPADLGANDQSFHFQATTTPPREFIWSGTAWVETTGLLDPTTTLGDLLVRGSAVVSRLGKGTNGQVLTANAAAPLGVDWEVPPGGSGSTSGVISAFGRIGNVVGATGDYTVAQITNAVANTRQVLAGAGLTGGGALSSDVTLAAKAMVASGASHSAGTVPDPGVTAGTTHYLREDATWVVPPAGAVTSVFTRTGAVVAATGDYTVAQVTNAVAGATGLLDANVVTKVGASGQIVEGGITDLSAGNSGKVTILASGYVGLGTAAATAPLHVLDNAGNGIVIQRTATNAHKYNMLAGGSGQFCIYDETNGTYPISINASGNVGISVPTANASFQLQVNTDSAAKPSTNTWTISSDMRTKRNVSRFEGDIEVIRRLDPIVAEYNGKAGTPDGARVVSFDAERLREIVPAAVSSVRGKLNPEDAEETDLLGVNTHEVFYQMLRAIQHLDREVEELKRKLAA